MFKIRRNMMVKKYKTKPCEIEAVEWNGRNIREILHFMDENFNMDFIPCCTMEEEKWYEYCEMVRRNGLEIKTLEGVMLASVGDYIIKGLRGEFYPCKPDVFEKKYEVSK